MRRTHLSLRRKTSVAQKDPERLASKLVSYVLQLRRLQKKNNYSANNIATDESPVWNDMVSETTIDCVGKKTITMKTTGHEKCHVSVCLADKADGTKLKPSIKVLKKKLKLLAKNSAVLLL